MSLRGYRRFYTRPVRITHLLIVIGAVCLVTGLLLNDFVAHHSSPGSSPGSLTAIAFAALGLLIVAFAWVMLCCITAARFWRRLRLQHKASNSK
jgi:hypothetical protein